MLRLLICGIGPVASGFTLGQVLGRAWAAGRLPSGVVNLGIAGSYDCRRAPVESLVLANGENFPEYGVWPEPETEPETELEPEPEEEETERGSPFRGAGGRLPLGFPQTTLPSGPVFDRLALAPDIALGNMGLNCHSCFRQGPGVTVAGVSGSLRRARRMADLTDGLMENMEGFSLALGCLLLHLPFAELRAISNSAGLRPPLSWDTPAALAALSRATHTLLAPWL
jgi:futalosine hydrolase